MGLNGGVLQPLAGGFPCVMVSGSVKAALPTQKKLQKTALEQNQVREATTEENAIFLVSRVWSECATTAYCYCSPRPLNALFGVGSVAFCVEREQQEQMYQDSTFL